MDVKLLREIKETEDRAVQIIANAEEKRAELLEQAKLQCMKQHEDFLKKTEERKESMLAERTLEVRKQKKQIAAAYEKDVQTLRETAAGHADKAAATIVELFKKAV